MSEDDCEKKGDELSKLFYEKTKKVGLRRLFFWSTPKAKPEDVKLAVTASYYYLLAKKYDKVARVLGQISTQRVSKYTVAIYAAARNAKTGAVIAIINIIKSSWLQKHLSVLVDASFEYDEKNDMVQVLGVEGWIQKAGALIPGLDFVLFFGACHYSALYPKELLEAMALEKRKG